MPVYSVSETTFIPSMGAERTAVEALDELMKTPEKYCSTKLYDISMSFSEGKWTIQLPDDLYEAISGRFKPDN